MPRFPRRPKTQTIPRLDTHQSPQPFSYLLFLLSSLTSLSVNCVTHGNSKEKMALQLQAPTTCTLHTTKCPPSLAPTGYNAGLRKPFNPFALKSSFFASSLNLLLHPNQHHLVTSGAPRISMRVASKQAYICRDCGFHFIFSLTLYYSHYMDI